ncbi:MAG: hypothetical protein AB7G75_06375 [Candidatus Binatia bacterium]
MELPHGAMESHERVSAPSEGGRSGPGETLSTVETASRLATPTLAFHERAIALGLGMPVIPSRHEREATYSRAQTAGSSRFVVPAQAGTQGGVLQDSGSRGARPERRVALRFRLGENSWLLSKSESDQAILVFS